MTAKNRVDFIHIGLGKCASTTLQTYWHKSDNYQSLNALKLGQVSENLLEKGENANSKSLPNIDLNLNVGSGEFSVFTSEALSWGYLNESNGRQKLIADKRKLVAAIVKRASLSNKVLIVVRNPVSWIRSAHAQSINQGNFESLAVFLDRQRTFIEQTLDMQTLFSCWKGFEICVLPMEYLIKKPEKFWTLYESDLNVGRPECARSGESSKVNSSDKQKLYKHAKLNNLFWLLQENIDNSAEYGRDFGREKATLTQALDTSRRWATRRFINYCELQALENLIVIDRDEEQRFLDLCLPDSMVECIESKYLKPLENFINFDRQIINEYKEDLFAQLRN